MTAELTVEYLKLVNVQDELLWRGARRNRSEETFYDRRDSRYCRFGAGEERGAVCDYRVKKI